MLAFALVFLPNTILANVVLLLCYTTNVRRAGFSKNNVRYYLLFCLLVSMSFALVNAKSLHFNEVIRTLLILITLLPWSGTSITAISYKGFKLGVVALLFFQISIGLGFEPSLLFRERFYPIQLDGWQYEKTIASFLQMNSRMGGLAYNPNILSLQYSFLYIYSLVIFKRRNLLVLIGLVLAASRTGMVVILAYEFFRAVPKIKLRFLLFAVLFSLSQVRILRVFDIISGLSGQNASIALKYRGLYELLNDRINKGEFYELAFGSGSITANMDSDVGHILDTFGAFGLFLIIITCAVSFLESNNRVTWSFILWSLSSTIFMNFRGVMMLGILLRLVNINNEKDSLDRSRCRSITG